MVRTVESPPRTSIRSGPSRAIFVGLQNCDISQDTKPAHMRFISAIIVTSVIASLGVQGLRPPEQPTRRSYGSSSHVPISSEKQKPTETTTVSTIRTPASSDTVWTSTPVTTKTDIIRTSTAAPSKATGVPQKDEGACEKFAFFHGWDVDYGDVSSLSCLPAPL